MRRRVARRARLEPPHRRPPGLTEHQIGLAAARRLRRWFPDFWAAHVAGCRVTSTTLLGVGAALITLTGGVVAYSPHGEDYYADLIWGGLPEQQLHHPPRNLTNGEDPWVIVDRFLAAPDLAVYGLDLAAEDVDAFPVLAVALQSLTGQECFERDMLDVVLGVNEESWRQDLFVWVATETPRIACAGDGLDQLIAALRGTMVCGEDLAAVLAYAHQRTTTPFANIGPFELDDMRCYTGGAEIIVWDDDSDLTDLACDQQAARRLCGAYERIEARLVVNPGLIAEIGMTVAAAAAHAGLSVWWPTTMEESDGDSHDDDATGEAVAAPPGAPVAS